MLKDMPKNEGAKGQIQQHLSGGTKTEPPVDEPPTYQDLNVTYKDAGMYAGIYDGCPDYGRFIVKTFESV